MVRKRRLAQEKDDNEVVQEEINRECADKVDEVVELQSEEIEPPEKRRRNNNPKSRNKTDDGYKMLYEYLQKHTKQMEGKIKELELGIKQIQNQVSGDLNAKDNSNNIVPELTTTVGTNNKQKEYVPCNIMNVATEKPKFSKDKIHPVTFLEDLASYLRKLPNKEKELELAYECLQGEARDWVRLYKSRWQNLEDFKNDFLSTYWGETEQNKIRREIVCSTWDRTKQPTMLGHFLNLTAQVRMLSFTIPEKQLVDDMMRHYPISVQQMWAITKGETIHDATEFLRKQDDINKQEEPTTSANKSNYKERKSQNSDVRRSYRSWKKPVYPQVQYYPQEYCNVVSNEVLDKGNEGYNDQNDGKENEGAYSVWQDGNNYSN